MKSNIRVNNFNEIIRLGATLGNFCFRGHQKIVEDSPLTPKVFRNYNDFFEPYFIHEFIRYGHSYTNDFPVDNIRILFLMQHYGLPTRLLDWTENILVALFFTLNELEFDNSDGELWILNPEFLNSLTVKDFDYDNAVNYIVNEPFLNSNSKIVKDNNDKKIENPIAIWPNHFDKRMIAQQSLFTIHNANSSKIIDLISSNENIERVIIPKEMKTVFRRTLYEIGISERILFPDLEGLARDIYKHRSYGATDKMFGVSIKSVIDSDNK